VLDPRSGLELAGVKVYSDDKDGVDAGVLLGRDPVGVTAAKDTATILALEADCVVYTPRLTDVDEVCAILASGKNVVTTAFQFHPDRIAAADRDRLLAACHQGGTTVHGCGLTPANISGALPLALSGMSRTIAKLTLQERADWSVYEARPSRSTTCGSVRPSTRSASPQTISSRSTVRSSPSRSGCWPTPCMRASTM